MNYLGRTALLAFSAMASLMPMAASAQGALAASYNEQAGDVDYRDLERASARWVRMFVSMPLIDRGAGGNATLGKIVELSGKGYKTVLSLKMAFVGTVPPEVGSDGFVKDIARLNAALPRIMDKVDILVIGNDPFLEVPEKNRNEGMNAYYEAIAKHVIEYRAKHCGSACKTRLYLGSLTGLEGAAGRNKIAQRWMDFVKVTPELDGVGLQMHLTEAGDAAAYLKYVLARMRPEQKFVVTDLSIVKSWEANIRGNIPAAFADKYGAPRNAQNWQIIKAALETPFSKLQWDEFLSQSPWYESRKHFLATQMKLFRDSGRLAVAAVSFAQGSSPADKLSPGAAAWQLNSVVAQRTVKRNPDGTSNFTYGFIDDFKALQQQ